MYGIYADQANGGARGVNGAAAYVYMAVPWYVWGMHSQAHRRGLFLGWCFEP